MNDFKKKATRLWNVRNSPDEKGAKKRFESALRHAYEKGLEDAAQISLDYCIDSDCPNYHDDEVLLKSHLQGLTVKIMKLKRPVGGEK